MQLQRSKKREEMHTFAMGGLRIPHDFLDWIPGNAVWPEQISLVLACGEKERVKQGWIPGNAVQPEQISLVLVCGEKERVKQGGLKYSLVALDGKFSKAKRYESRLMSEMGQVQMENFQNLKDKSPD